MVEVDDQPVSELLEADAVLLERALSRRDPRFNKLAIEKLGSPAFDWLGIELRNQSRPVAQRLRALGLLSLLGRHFCADRKGQLIDLSLMLADDVGTPVELRSASIRMAILTFSTASDLVEPSRYLDGRSPREVHERIARVAQTMGTEHLTEPVERLVRSLLQATPPP